MGTKLVPGQLFVARDPGQVARQAATQIAQVLREATSTAGGGPDVTLALSGGNTPRETYALLAAEPGIDWGRVRVFWVDERAVAPTDDRSNYRWARTTLLDPLRLSADRVHRMPAEKADAEGAAAEYERLVRAHVAPEPRPTGGNLAAERANVPRIDVMVLGIGDDGHTASLFPGEPTVDERDRLIVAVPARGSREARMTMTAPLLQNAKHAFVLVVGQGKNAALERAWDVQGDVHQTPSRVLRDSRGSLTWVVDAAAAGLGPASA